jgi:hypothetical protein
MHAGPNPFVTDGVWLKAALHSHTSQSDGDLAPPAHAAHYEWAGFDVLAITDHWKITRVPATEHLLLVPGAELAVDPIAQGRYSEIIAIGIETLPEDPGGDRRYWEPIDNYEFRTFPDYSAAAAFITGQGGMAYLAHPYWSSLTPEIVLGSEGVGGLEVFNSGCQRDGGRGDSSYLWDLALEAGRPLFGIATDDAHYPLFEIGDAWTMVRAAERSSEAVVAALRAGLSYASTGPVLHDVRRDGDLVEVRSSPCLSIVLQSRFEQGRAVRADHRGRQEHARILERADDGLIVRARFDIAGEDVPYVRLVATDAQGRAAWTNPI